MTTTCIEQRSPFVKSATQEINKFHCQGVKERYGIKEIAPNTPNRPRATKKKIVTASPVFRLVVISFCFWPEPVMAHLLENHRSSELFRVRKGKNCSQTKQKHSDYC